MDKRGLQTYSTWAKENLENQIEVSLKALGINDENNIKQAKKVGDVTTIEGDPTSYPADLFGKRERIIDLVKRQGYQNVIEEFAYTWFNRFVALRFMEVHGFLPHGFRVLSNPAGGIEPEILKNLNLVKDDLRLDMDLCAEYKQQGKIEELFRHILIKQCNVLSGILPMLFSSDMGYLELLLPTNLLKGDTVITRLNEIPEAAFMEDVEIIGWMYQFYISSKKDAVYASKKTITKDTLPAVTQLFTPDWIVRYMAQNSVGRLWLESYPNSSLRSEMKYYVEDAEQTEEVQKKIDEIKYKNVNPEDIRIIEPCCGSGHILVYVFDLLYKMYEERGYQKRDISTLILKKNLVGLDVDKRAAQLALFSLIMKARSVNNRFFNDQYYETPHVYELKDSSILKELEYRKQLKDLNILNDSEFKLITYLVDTFENGKTIGSLLKVKPIDFACLDGSLDKISKNAVSNLFNIDFLNMGMKRLRELSNLAKVLSAKYDVMITNPPYRPISSMEAAVSTYAANNYPNSKADLFAMFMETGFAKKNGFVAMINMHGWMSLSTYERLREDVLRSKSIVVMAHLGARAFDTISGEVVQTTSFVLRNNNFKGFTGTFIDLVDGKSETEKQNDFNDKSKLYRTKQDNFSQIPGIPFTAYWVSEDVVKCFEFPVLETVFTTREGMATAGNDVFLRYWHEVSKGRITFGCKDNMQAKTLGVKWVPYNKGGSARDWYGNNEYVVDWSNDGYAIKHNKDPKTGRIRSHNYNGEYGFKEGLTWSAISSGSLSVRYCENGFLFDSKGAKGFCKSNEKLLSILGLLNSKVAMRFLRFLSPTLDFKVGDIICIPYGLEKKHEEEISGIVKDSINLAKEDWDSFETSWDFAGHPLLPQNGTFALSSLHEQWKIICDEKYEKLRANKERP